MSIRPVKTVTPRAPDPGGCRGQAAPRLRVRRDQRIRSVPAVRRFPQREPGRLPGRLPVASAPRNRDHNLCAVGHRRARRQPGQYRSARFRRRSVDDGGQRHHAPGDAQGRRRGADARLPAVGQPAVEPEDDAAALPGRAVGRDPRDHRRRRHYGTGGLRRVLGQERPGRRRRRRSALPGHPGCRRASGAP